MSELSLEFGYSYIEVQHILGKMSVCKLWWENCLFAEMGWGIHYSTFYNLPMDGQTSTRTDISSC